MRTASSVGELPLTLDEMCLICTKLYRKHTRTTFAAFAVQTTTCGSTDAGDFTRIVVFEALGISFYMHLKAPPDCWLSALTLQSV